MAEHKKNHACDKLITTYTGCVWFLSGLGRLVLDLVSMGNMTYMFAYWGFAP